jgi:hypothetical protein
MSVTLTQGLAIANRQIETASNLTLATQGNLGLANSVLAASGNLTVQGQTIALRDSRLESGGELTVRSPQTLAVEGSRVWANGNLRLQAGTQASFTETATSPLTIQTSSDLLIQGNTGLTIQALGLPQSAIRSGESLSLISDGTITGNTRFAVGKNFSTSNTAGGAGTFNYNPVNATGPGIISAIGDVNFGNYEGMSLKIEAGGSIQGGNIRITAANTGLSGTDPDIALLSATPSLILRAGLLQGTSLPNTPRPTTALQNAPNTSSSQSLGGTTFALSGSPSTQGNITVGTIEIAPSTRALANIASTTVVLSATGTITTGTIATGRAGSPGDTQPGGSVQITATGDIKTLDITVSSNQTLAFRQPIALTSSQGSITTGELQVFGQNAFVSLAAARNIEVAVINNRAPAGSVEINAGGIFRATRGFQSGQNSTVPVVYQFPDRAALRAFLEQTTTLQGANLETLLDQIIQPPTEAFVSIRVNPVPSYRADANSFAPAGTPLLRIQHGSSAFVSGPIDVDSASSDSRQFSTLNVNLLPDTISGTAGAILFSTPNATLAQSFPNAIFQPNTVGSYLQVTTTFRNSDSPSPPTSPLPLPLSPPTDQSIQQQFTQTQGSSCTPSLALVSGAGGSREGDRSSASSTPTASTPCPPAGAIGNTAADDAEILKLLDGGVR